MEKISHKIFVSVAASVIAALILRFLTGISLLDFIGFGRDFLKECWHASTGKILIPRWLFSILLVLTGAAIGAFFSNLAKRQRERSHTSYRKDTFEGLVWRWEYSLIGEISHTWCYCPTCDTLLVYRDTMKYEAEVRPAIRLICERCDQEKAVLLGHRGDVVARIERLIDRNIRVGDWS